MPSRAPAVFNDAGTLAWTELRTPDPEGARDFYPAVFGWTVDASDHFTHWGVDGADFGGAKEQDDDERAGVATALAALLRGRRRGGHRRGS